jgi:hypothetical protein
MSATCLKMAGRLGEEETAERLGKPVSGTVTGGVGPAGRFPARNRRGAGPGNRNGRGLSLPISAEGAQTPREVLSIERSGAETSGNTVKEDRTPGEEGPKSRVFGLGLGRKYRKGHVFCERKGSTGGEQPR